VISRNATIRAVKDHVSCALGEEAVVLHLGSSSYFGLNEIGAVVWNLVQQPRRVQDLVQHITQEYEVDRVQCERDLFGLLEEMAAAGLIEVRDDEVG
jgi:hypothetical protein